MAAAEEKKLLCCFVLSSKRVYGIFALDLCETRIRGEGNSELNADDLSRITRRGNDVTFNRYTPPLPAPVLTIPKYVDPYNIPDGMAFGFLDGKLYMIGGRNPSSYCESLKVYVFDTNEIISSPPQRLDHKIHVTDGPALNSSKPEPVVIPVAGKLFVFCRNLYSYNSEVAKDLIEVLEPSESNSWSRIPLPPNLSELAANMQESEDAPARPFNIESHATVGSSIVLYLPLDNYYKGHFFILDAETKTWTQHVKQQQFMPPFRRGCLFWDGIWFCGTSSFGRVLFRGVEEEEGSLKFTKEIVNMSGKVVLQVDHDSTNLLVFSHGQTTPQVNPPHPDYFRVDLVRVDKSKKNNEGAAKITGNLVKSMLFRFWYHSYPDFKLESCFYLIKK